MKASKKEYLKTSFVLDAKNLEGIGKAFEDFIGSGRRPKCSLKRSDNITNEFESLEELLAYDIPAGKTVEEIELSFYSIEKSARLTFRAQTTMFRLRSRVQIMTSSS